MSRRKTLSAHVTETEESGLQALHPCAKRSHVSRKSTLDEVNTATVDGSTKPLVVPCAQYVCCSCELNSHASCRQESREKVPVQS